MKLLLLFISCILLILHIVLLYGGSYDNCQPTNIKECNKICVVGEQQYPCDCINKQDCESTGLKYVIPTVMVCIACLGFVIED